MRWSYSLDRAFRRCERAYFIEHVMARAVSNDPERREAFVLSQLQQLPAWTGSLVHNVLAIVIPSRLRFGQWPTVSELQDVARERIAREFAFSAARRYWDRTLAKSTTPDYRALYEHEYERPLPEDACERVGETARSSFTALMAQQEFVRHVRAGSGHTAERGLTFPFDGAQVRANLDLLFRSKANTPVVVDWKLTKSDTSDAAMQLAIYALAVLRTGQWTGPVQDIEVIEVNLLKGEVRSHRMDATRIDAAEDYMFRGMDRMRRALGDGAYETLDIDDFALAARPNVCASCRVARLCVRLLARSGRGEAAETIQGRLF